jgi:mannan polymerase II complex MNN10 subunit
MNSGSMLFRATSRVFPFIGLLHECHRTEEKSDQDCISYVLGRTEPESGHVLAAKEWMRRTIWIPQKTINAFPKDIHCWETENGYWQPGDFVIHFAGAWAHLKEENPTGVLMEKYRHSIVHN